jgi:2-dehydropantoate 2-reductase
MSTRICVAGAGAIGGVLAVRLMQAGHCVSVLARGETLNAIRETGLQLNDEAPVRLPASEIAEGAPVDVLFLAVKAHSLPALLPKLQTLIGPETIVVPAVNGIPWWYFAGLPGPYMGQAVRAVDPEENLLGALDWRTIIGAVIYLTAEAPTPARVLASPPYRLILGEPSHKATPRLAQLCAMLQAAGFDAAASERIRDDIWTKLVANLASNPLSVVAEATLGEIFGRPELREAVLSVMREAMLVGACYGARFTVDPLKLMEVGRLKGAFKTSTLQDYQKRRPLELAGIGDAVLELAARFDIPMPTTRLLLSLTRFRGRYSEEETKC